MDNELRPGIPPISAPTGEVAPRAEVSPVPIDARALALWHRRMLWVLLFSFLAEFTLYGVFAEDPNAISLTAKFFYFGAILLSVGAAILRAVTNFKVAKLMRESWPWLAAILSLPDLLGFCIIFSLNKRARRKLRASGIRVGFWGANAKKIPA